DADPEHFSRRFGIFIQTGHFGCQTVILPHGFESQVNHYNSAQEGENLHAQGRSLGNVRFCVTAFSGPRELFRPGTFSFGAQFRILNAQSEVRFPQPMTSLPNMYPVSAFRSRESGRLACSKGRESLRIDGPEMLKYTPSRRACQMSIKAE